MSKRSKAKLRPYPPEDPCPCDSGLAYVDCCQSKIFKFQLDARNNVVRSVPIPPVLREQLKRQEKEFKDCFGRKPGKGDRVFFKIFEAPSEDHYWDTMIETALSVGIKPATVYAMQKTGLIPSEGNLDRFTELELDEFEEAAEEYEALKKSGVDPLDPNPSFSKKQSAKFSELVTLVSRAPVVLASIIDRGSAGPVQFVDFFQLLFATQALQFLKRFCWSLRLEDFDGDEGTTRSIYEAFLRIRYLRYRPEKVEVFLALASVGKGEYEYLTKGSRTDWSVIKNAKTNKTINVNVSNYTMASCSGEASDVDVYRILFRRLSRSIHPNVDNIGQQFSVEKGFSLFAQSNPFDGLLLAAFVLVLLFDEISQMTCLRVIQRRDARFAMRKIARTVDAIESGALQIFPGEFVCLKDKMRLLLRAS